MSESRKDESRTVEPPRAGSRRRFLRIFLGASLAGAAILFVVLRWVWVPYRVLGSSMLPTLVGVEAGRAGAGDIVLVSRLAYVGREPRRWDVVVVSRDGEGGSEAGETSRESVKRVAGLPGESLEIREGRLLVEGRPLVLPGALEGNYIVGKGPHGRGLVRLGRDEYFLLGDNSYYSKDSRQWGPVPRSSLRGRAFWIAYPPGRWGPLR
jgi:signal peptidase I